MKSELLIILALAAALAFHRGAPGPQCGPSGCWMMPPEFQQSIEAIRMKAAVSSDGRETGDQGSRR